MTFRYLSRRTFLRGSSGVALALPLLEVMGCSERDRQTAAGAHGSGDGFGGPAPDDVEAPKPGDLEPGGALAPRRLFTMITPNGYLDDLWFPTAGRMGGTPRGRDFALPPLLADLEALRSHLLLFRGIDNRVESNGHYRGFNSLLSAMACSVDPDTGQPFPDGEQLSLGPTIDHLIAQDIIARDPKAPPYVFQGLRAGGNKANLYQPSYAGSKQPLPQHLTPLALFEQLFSAGGGDTAAAEELQARRLRLVDDVLGSYKSLRSRVSSRDAQRLDAHIDALDEVERRLDSLQRACDVPDAPMSTSKSWSSHRLPEVNGLYFEVLRVAFQCDLVRVATYTPRNEGAQGDQTFGWLGLAADGKVDCNLPHEERPACEVDTYCADNCEGIHSTNHHALSHHEGSEVAAGKLAAINRWYVSELGRFVQGLADTEEAGGTLLDSSVAMLTSGIARGGHSTHDMKFLLAGSAGGSLATGQYLDYSAASRSHGDLLATLRFAMGFTEETTFGAPEHAQGLLSEMLA